MPTINECLHSPTETCGFSCWYYWNIRKPPALRRQEAAAAAAAARLDKISKWQGQIDPRSPQESVCSSSDVDSNKGSTEVAIDGRKSSGDDARKRLRTAEETGEPQTNKRTATGEFGDGRLRAEGNLQNGRDGDNEYEPVRYMSYGRFVRQEMENRAMRAKPELKKVQKDCGHADAQGIELGGVPLETKKRPDTIVVAALKERQGEPPPFLGSPMMGVSVDLGTTESQTKGSAAVGVKPEPIFNATAAAPRSSKEISYHTLDTQQASDFSLPNSPNSDEPVRIKKHSCDAPQSQVPSPLDSDVKDCPTEDFSHIDPLELPSTCQVYPETPKPTPSQDAMMDHSSLAEYEGENAATLDSGVESLFADEAPTREEVEVSCTPAEASESEVIDTKDQHHDFSGPAEPSNAPEIGIHESELDFGTDAILTVPSLDRGAEELGALDARTVAEGEEDRLEGLTAEEDRRGTVQLDGRDRSPTPRTIDSGSLEHTAEEDDDGWSF